jgi:hypothetical protein
MEEVAAVPRRVHGPCLLNIAQGGRTKVSGLRDAGEMGYKVAILPMLFFHADAGGGGRHLLASRPRDPPDRRAVSRQLAVIRGRPMLVENMPGAQE